MAEFVGLHRPIISLSPDTILEIQHEQVRVLRAEDIVPDKQTLFLRPEAIGLPVLPRRTVIHITSHARPDSTARQLSPDQLTIDLLARLPVSSRRNTMGVIRHHSVSGNGDSSGLDTFFRQPIEFDEQHAAWTALRAQCGLRELPRRRTLGQRINWILFKGRQPDDALLHPWKVLSASMHSQDRRCDSDQ